MLCGSASFCYNGDEMLLELNSCPYQSAYVKIGSMTHHFA